MLTGVIGWVGITVAGNAQVIARLEERIATLSEQMRDIKGVLKNEYTRQEAVKDFRLVHSRVDSLNSRLKLLEIKSK